MILSKAGSPSEGMILKISWLLTALAYERQSAAMAGSDSPVWVTFGVMGIGYSAKFLMTRFL
ncbi:hypothetical protein VE30_04555 [Vreelandella aquamarina]|uniref:Uncharacterized protein n=1 Tax=Vreelandella aquamarina TaxID=77097 RepID=A0A0D7UZY8_9GAMM|nr:hypothetical protein VE30_04555 [Halomonas meridiana]BBM05315.1 hypothetical protein HAALTHF_10420n [Halomonas axialensis]BCA93548.1 hypothetical protein HMSLTHF_33230 [Halomonas meridiana]